VPGAAAARRSIVEMLDLADGVGGEPPAVLPTVARTGEGAAEVLDAVSARFEWLRAGGEIRARRAARLRRRVLDLYRAEVLRLAMGSVDDDRFARALLAASATTPGAGQRAGAPTETPPGGAVGLDGEADSQQNRAPLEAGPAGDPFDPVDPYELADRLVGEFVGGFRQHRGV